MLLRICLATKRSRSSVFAEILRFVRQLLRDDTFEVGFRTEPPPTRSFEKPAWVSDSALTTVLNEVRALQDHQAEFFLEGFCQ